MRNKLVLFLGAWGVLYVLSIILLFNAAKEPLNFVAVAAGIGMIGFGSFLALQKPKSDGHGMTQQYIVATTVQILGALAFILFSRFADSSSYKTVAFHFLAAFLGGLVIQSILLIRYLRDNNS